MIDVTPTAIPGLRIVATPRFRDERGMFTESWNRRSFAEAGIHLDFVQDNHSRSLKAGTVRGMHYQTPPFAQDKLVRVTRGRILDVAVDLRRSSPTFGRHVALELSAEEGRQLLIPIGFAHGFCTLEPDTDVAYKATAPYSPVHDAGLAWDDADLAIVWPVSPNEVVLSEKDCRQPRFADLPAVFE